MRNVALGLESGVYRLSGGFGRHMTLLHGSAGWSRRGGGVGGCFQFPEIGCPPCRSKPMPLAGTTFRDNGTG